MSSTPFEVYVFDFDGTLVQSAAVKRQAFFDVFPVGCATAVAKVLERDPDGSRHEVIPAMIAEARNMGLDAEGLDAPSLVAAYGRAAEAGVMNAAAMPKADAVLQAASAKAAYVASMTPHDDLQALLDQRGWLRLLRGAYGYPHSKDDVVGELLQRHGIAPSQLIVVGDGTSDRAAAERNGCAFHAITGPQSLAAVPGLGVGGHV